MNRYILPVLCALAGCSGPTPDPVGAVIAGYTAADSAAAIFLKANPNAATATATTVKVCEAAAYGVLEPVKVAWVAGQPVAEAALGVAQQGLADLQSCLSSAGVKL